MDIPVRIVHEYAQDKADVILLQIHDMTGTEAYDAWLDEIYGDSATMPTSDLLRIATEKLDELASRECDHVLPEQVCEFCTPAPSDEIPF